MNEIIALVVSAKRCVTCNCCDSGEEVPFHEFARNHDGSSKAMEPLSCLCLLEDTYNNYHTVMMLVVTDDDTSMEANCRHLWRAKIDSDDFDMEEKDWPLTKLGSKKKDNGKLPLYIPAPTFVVDPTHHIKVMTKALFKMMKKLSKKKTNCTDIDCYCVKHYLGYFIKKSASKTFEEFKQDSNAIVDHLVNDHTYWNKEWCPILKATAEGKDVSKMNLKYRCKIENGLFHKQMKEALAKYFTDKMLKQLHHEYNSQKNEDFNKSVTKYFPKDRMYSMSMSLMNCVGIAAGMSILKVHLKVTEILAHNLRLSESLAHNLFLLFNKMEEHNG